jgi:hypothetical protein
MSRGERREAKRGGGFFESIGINWEENMAYKAKFEESDK